MYQILCMLKSNFVVDRSITYRATKMSYFDRDALIVLNVSVIVFSVNLAFVFSVFVYFCCCVIEVVDSDLHHDHNRTRVDEFLINDDAQTMFILYETTV